MHKSFESRENVGLYLCPDDLWPSWALFYVCESKSVLAVLKSHSWVSSGVPGALPAA